MSEYRRSAEWANAAREGLEDWLDEHGGSNGNGPCKVEVDFAQLRAYCHACDEMYFKNERRLISSNVTSFT